MLHSGWKTYAAAALPLASSTKAKGHGGTWVLVDRTLASSSSFPHGAQLEGGSKFSGTQWSAAR
eukprot:12881503-Prorocentrum_lima.AAC.1